ncbi:unnamed protein product [Urochloa decumbens]|uniref:Leucine-rich repeat-containing N-terminal plant-type domain-containing protein n=1 Tax=Urochloa decumbens TaxID=240449 RepID=A0ABC8WD33_9POAL
MHLHGLLLPCCIAVLVGAVIPAIAGGQREADALLKWKASLTDADASLSSWSLEAINSTTSPCNWAFVGCSSTGDITALNITNARIKGTLAGLDFSAFPRLEDLVLGQNDLYGTIPEGIGNLTSLTSLRMYGQRLSGPIPRSIGRLKQLESLQLEYLQLSGTIPVEIGNLTSLQDLRLSGIGLAGLIPPAIGRLEKLSRLDLGSNNLTGSIPSEIGNMTELEWMDLGSNCLEGELPGTLSRLQQLFIIVVSDNQLGGRITITPQLGNYSNLAGIVIASNNFSGISAGPICTVLASIIANDNWFASLQDLNFQNCTSLQDLDLSRNRINGDLNEWLGTLPKKLELSHLNLDENNITGGIPPALGNMTSLWFLNLGHNQLTGAIPPELGKLHHLISLNLSYNQLSGPLPLAFQNISTLVSLDLSSCSLTGQLHDLLFTDQSDFPSNYSFPGNTMLALSSNHISGTIPKVLCNANSLVMLDLSNNALHGDLPNCLWDLTSLQFMDLSNNSFSGEVPFSRSSNITLQSLHLANNHFEGNFPSIIRKFDKLITLDLGGNNFTGELPSCIAKSLPQLRYLRLSSNMFHGVIPEEILQFQQLRLLDLSHNKLSGPIPVDFANFTGMKQEQANGTTIYDSEYFGFEQIQLVWKNEGYEYSRTISFITGIDLSCNSLSQAIPEGITTLSGLKYLNFSRNQFSGGIPKDIGNLAFLESLDLSWNQLKGEIPLSVADLKYLSTLNLSNNDLSGRIPRGSQLQTLDGPSSYSNNPGLCGFPLKECANASGSTHNRTNPGDDREVLWLSCFVIAGAIFGFWLSWGVLFCKETWRYALYRYVDNILERL